MPIVPENCDHMFYGENVELGYLENWKMQDGSYVASGIIKCEECNTKFGIDGTLTIGDEIK